MEFTVISSREGQKRREANSVSKTVHDMEIVEETATFIKGYCKVCDCVHTMDKLVDLNTRYQSEMGLNKVTPSPSKNPGEVKE